MNGFDSGIVMNKMTLVTQCCVLLSFDFRFLELV